MSTGVACPSPFIQSFNNSGAFNVGGSILTQVGGINTATYQDIGLTTPLPNPIPINSRGEVSDSSGHSQQLFLTPNTVYVFTYFDKNGNQLDQAAYVNGVQVVQTQSSIGLLLYPRTTAEITAAVTPTAYYYAPGDIRRYGAAVDGVTDDLTAINNAILVAAAGGTPVTAPGGTSFHSAAITMKPFVQLRGAGKFATTFLSSHAGNGIATTSAINTSTGVGTEIRDCRFKNTNAANTGGGVVDVGGTEVIVRNVGILGFAYGVIFDQTELGDIDLCDIQQFLTGGVWLVNGADHTPLANAGFTNRISVQRCQFNGDGGAAFAAQGIAIIDDGGTQHTFRNNNYNLCVNHFRIAGARVVKIEDSEMESNTAVCIVFATTTSVLGTSVGTSSTVVIDNNYIQPGTSVCTMTSAVATITVTNNRFITSAATFIGTSTVGVVVAYGNFDSNVGTIFDGLAVSHFEMELSSGLATLKATNVSLRGQVVMTNPQVTGWGTPTGAALVNNYPGATATLVQTSNVVAELIIALKNFGLFGA